MTIIDKIDNFLNEKSNVPAGLLDWVASYIEMRNNLSNKTGITLATVKQLKKDIDVQIKDLKLNKKDVWGYFGDPDDPKQKDEVMKKVKNYLKRGK